MRFSINQLLTSRLKVQKLIENCCIGESIQFVYFEQFINPNRLVRRFRFSITSSVKIFASLHAQKIVEEFVRYAEKELGRRYCQSCIWCDKINGFL